MNLTVAAIQLVSTADIDHNIARCSALIGEAANQGAELIVLPENALVYGAPLATVAARQTELKALLADWAQKFGVWLVGGSLPWLDSSYANKPGASCFVFNSQGEEILHYRKCHLFDADVIDATGSYRESDSYSAGSEIGIFETPWGKFGVAICYDLRFPEYFRRLIERQVIGVCIPSAFTYVTGEAHWEVLVRARAIENQMFVIAANQGGEHSPLRKTWGESMIVNPWGRILKKTALDEALVKADINLDEVKDIRRKMPVLKHRKF